MKAIFDILFKRKDGKFKKEFVPEVAYVFEIVGKDNVTQCLGSFKYLTYERARLSAEVAIEFWYHGYDVKFAIRQITKDHELWSLPFAPDYVN